jgi:hypothetical protein
VLCQFTCLTESFAQQVTENQWLLPSTPPRGSSCTTTTLPTGVTANNELTNSHSQDLAFKGQTEPSKLTLENQTIPIHIQEEMTTTALPSHQRKPTLFSGPHPPRDHTLNTYPMPTSLSDAVRHRSAPEPSPKGFVKVAPVKKIAQHDIFTKSGGPAAESSPTANYLDIPTNLTPPEPCNITLPPRLSHRSQTARLSIILSQLHNSTRNVCLFVSKSWRYASALFSGSS